MIKKELIFSLGFVIAAMACAANAEANSCRTIGGLAEMPTRAIAEFMAEAALKNAIAAHNMTAAGPVTMKCKDDTFTTTCTARRRACG
jgi:hypothetical protein